MSSSTAKPTFKDLNLPETLLEALESVGYESPSPIQAQTIPPLLAGKDVLGQAQTGTGKTAAFALPALANIDLNLRAPQVLVLAPTRELAIQVADAFKRYSANLKGFSVLPIYGGQEYRTQLRQLDRGPQVVVGTPGRVMDHMRRGTLKLDQLQCLVLDEADEMLRMGFIDDVEWILEQTPDQRQIALFSATMPPEISRIAKRHLNEPEEISIKVKTATATTIRQRAWIVSGTHKLDALTRILEVEEFDGMIIFVRTKQATTELAEKLEARGYAATALHGDIPQAQRERTIEQLKRQQLDILVATDVVARGLDVERISHVVNFDIPYDTEAYIHRIGRTGRAGRTGDAILFVAPRERRLLRNIEHATRQKIEPMELPSTDLVNDKRIQKFKDRITDTRVTHSDLSVFHNLVEQYQAEHDVTPLEIAATLAKLVQGEEPLLLSHVVERPLRPERGDRRGRGDRDRGDRGERRPRRRSSAPEAGMQRYRLDVGRRHQVRPGNIVGAIANEANIDSQNIGRIDIHDQYSLVDLPENLSSDAVNALKKVWVSGQQLNISRYIDADQRRGERSDEGFRPRHQHKGKRDHNNKRHAKFG